MAVIRLTKRFLTVQKRTFSASVSPFLFLSHICMLTKGDCIPRNQVGKNSHLIKFLESVFAIFQLITWYAKFKDIWFWINTRWKLPGAIYNAMLVCVKHYILEIVLFYMFVVCYLVNKCEYIY